MNKQELIDKAVSQTKGIWQSGGRYLKVSGRLNIYHNEFEELDFSATDSFSNDFWNLVCSRAEFQQRARELGWINGFKWGVEYPTNGKKPDLPDDVLIEVDGEVSEWLPPRRIRVNDWQRAKKFRIVDDRYKPVTEQPAGTKDDWFARGELPPVGVECEVLNSALDNADWEKCVIHFVGKIACVYTSESCAERCAYLDVVKFRPIKSEREKFGLSLWKTINYNDNMQDDEILRQSRFEDYCKAFDAGFKAPD